MWNTYSAGEVNGVLHLPDMVNVRIGIYDSRQKFLLSEMLWRNQENLNPKYCNVKRFGIHAEDGSYFDIDLCYFDFCFRLEFAAKQEDFVFRITPLSGNKDYLYFFISVSLDWLSHGSIDCQQQRFHICTPQAAYDIKLYGTVSENIPVNTNRSGITVPCTKSFYLTCNLIGDENDFSQLLAASKEKTINLLASSGGELEDTLDSIQKSLTWNTIYDHTKNRICIPVSRAWCTRNGTSFGSYVLFEWDTFFSALMGATYSKQTAYYQIDAIFQEMTSDGMIPNFGSQRGGSPDRSQPPVGSYCLLKLYWQFQDKSLLNKYYPLLCRWNTWWFQNRDGNQDGLLEWGSNPNPEGIRNGYFDNGNTMLCAMYESGLDNSPMYDDVSFNTQTHTMELADVGLNSLYALDCKCLAQISDILGHTKQSLAFSSEYKRMKQLMNDTMYDAGLHMYCNLHWNGQKDTRFSPTNFYPFIAGIPSPEQAENMIKLHLTNPKEFWGDYVIPSISMNSPAFQDQDYWRGRIWGPMNYLVYEGLKQSGLHDIAYEFACKSLNLFRKEWQEENHIHENYNAITGDGDDKPNADPFYTWGALLAYLPVCEMFYISPDGNIRLGNLNMKPSYLTGFPLGNYIYGLDTRNGFLLTQNDEPLIASDKPIALSGFQLNEDTITFCVEHNAACRLTLYPTRTIRNWHITNINKDILFTGTVPEQMSFTC